MEAFLSSTLAVALAEVGDKTQLLSLFLAARFSQRYSIIAAIFVATLINHGLSAWLGVYITQFIPAQWISYIVAGSFIGVGLWLLIPDKDDEEDSQYLRLGAFMATLILFFLAEIGDKTQIATVILAARYDATFWVVAGTTVGMLLANVPVVYAGQWLMSKLPLDIFRKSACVVFIALGIAALFSA